MNKVVYEILLACFMTVLSTTSLKFVTIDTAPYDGIRRFLWSANVSEIDVDVLEKPVDSASGTYFTISSFVQQLESSTNVLYCDSKFLSVAGSSVEILERWKRTGKDVLIELSMENEMWNLKCVLGEATDVLLVLEELQKVSGTLTSTDTAESVVELLSKNINKDNIFNKDIDVTVGQDNNSSVFLNVDKYPNMVGYTSDHRKFFNFETGDTAPLLLGSVSSYNLFTRLTNYVPGVFDLEKVAERANRNRVKRGSEYKPYDYFKPDYAERESDQYHRLYYKEDESRWEIMVTALLIKEDVPFLGIALDRFQSLIWLSKNRVIVVFNRFKHRDHEVKESFENYRGRPHQKAVIVYNSTTDEVKTNLAMHNTVLSTCEEYNCSWIWTQDINVLTVQTAALQKLAVFNFSVIAPGVISSLNEENPSTNFWGDTVANGFYKRSPDYFDIANRKIGGLFVVPYASGAHLVRADVMKELSFYDPGYKDSDSDIVFCNSVRKAGHLMLLKFDDVDFLFINGRTNETVPYPLLEHYPLNKQTLDLGYYMKWDHRKQRDFPFSDATPIQNPCTDVYLMEIFTDKFTRSVEASAMLSDKWVSREWHEGWGAVETVSLQDLGLDKGWESFCTNRYVETIVHRKYDNYYSPGVPIHTFIMRMTNESVATESLEGKGVYTVVVSLSTDFEGGDIYFNDHCKVSLKVGDFVIFPSRFTNRVRFTPPSSGMVVNIVSFFN